MEVQVFAPMPLQVYAEPLDEKVVAVIPFLCIGVIVLYMYKVGC